VILYICFMILTSLISERKTDFIELCKEHRVNKIYAFGSSISDRFDFNKSDIDIVVDLNILDPIDYGETLLAFWNKLELFFHRKVDLLTDESIRNPYLRKSIDLTKKLIYDRQGEKVFV
jgi:predicted nucleotidyltransferase